MHHVLKTAAAVALCSLMLGGPARTQEAASEDLDLMCAGIGEVAAAVMGARLAGVPMSGLMGSTERIDNDILRDITRVAISAAYDRPRFSSHEMQQRAIQDFRNDFERLCYAQMAARGMGGQP